MPDSELPTGLYLRGEVYWIERRIRGHKYHVSTRCTSLRAAMKQLEIFEANPLGFNPAGGNPGEPVVLTKPLIDEFHAWHLTRVSRAWALNVRSLLVDWANHLAGADLRHLRLIEDLKSGLKDAAQPHHRVKAIRMLLKWLRTEKGLVTRAQDTTLDLPVPILGARAAGEKLTVPWESIETVAALLAPHVRDALLFLAATGWHISEVRRFAQAGTVRPRRKSDPKHVVGVVGTRHKTGRQPHFTNLVHREHLKVAERVRARGTLIGNKRLWKHLVRACDEAGVERFTLGQMRHTVLTWLAVGMDIDDTSRFAGHASRNTTLNHYVEHEAAAIVPPARLLRVVR